MFEKYPEVMTVGTLQEILNKENNYKISKKTLYKLINNGDLKAKKLGRTWYISRENLNDYFC